jgi:hypothetical protein
VRYRILRAKYATPFRRVIVDRATAELGEQFQTQQAELEAARGQEERSQATARTLSRNLKMTLSPVAERRPETVPALRRLSELFSEKQEIT